MKLFHGKFHWEDSSRNYSISSNNSNNGIIQSVNPTEELIEIKTSLKNFEVYLTFFFFPQRSNNQSLIPYSPLQNSSSSPYFHPPPPLHQIITSENSATVNLIEHPRANDQSDRERKVGGDGSFPPPTFVNTVARACRPPPTRGSFLPILFHGSTFERARVSGADGPGERLPHPRAGSTSTSEGRVNFSCDTRRLLNRGREKG